MCKTRILSTVDQTVISSCIGCKAFHLWHNNLLLSFTEEAFISFREVVFSIPFHSRSLPFPDNEERVVLHTPNDDISFAFDFEEFDAFKKAIDEALYMNQIYTLMH